MAIKKRPWLRQRLLPLALEWGDFRFACAKLKRPATDEPALNGQIRRRAAFEAIITATRPEEIVETGTYRGATTAFLSQRFGLPVYSVERNRYFYLYSKLRLLPHWRTHVRHGDSRELLLARQELGARAAFFYLDAHWGDDLPVRQEVIFIIRHWREATICIDDFKVEHDPGYRFDHYPAGALTLEYLGLPDDAAVDIYWPAVSSGDETGLKRGAMFIALGEKTRPAVASCSPTHLQLYRTGK
jgi:hypothetical protein